MYIIIFSPLAVKKMKKLPKDVQERIMIALDRIKIRPQDFVKKLVGYDRLFRLRVGDYRVIIEIKGTELVILVVTLGLRKNIYEQL